MRLYPTHGNEAHQRARYRRCLQAYEAARVQTGPLAEETLQALLALAKAAHPLEGLSECTALMEQALLHADADALPACKAGLLRELAAAKRFQRRYDEVFPLLSQALEISEQAALTGEYAPPEIRAEIALTHAWRGDYTQAAAAMEPVIHFYLRRETPDEETSEALRFQVYMYLLAGENEAALCRQEMVCTIGEQLYGDTVDTRRERRRLRRLQQSLQAEKAAALPEQDGDLTDESEAPS